MENINYNSDHSFLPWEEFTNYSYENDGENQSQINIEEENQTSDGYNFYPDAGF